MAVSTCDPNQLDNLASCFRCYDADALSIKTYLLCQLLSQSTPPCVTPTAPINPTAKVITNTTIFIIWNQLSNSGSLITSYTVQWGTVSGVYTNSAVVGATPKSYTITGLTAGTQYFFAVKANSSAAVGCSSVNSSEGSATTTGAAPGNGLLNGLISYWQLAATPSPDLKDGNPATLTGGAINANGGAINNGPYVGLNGGVNSGYSVSPSPANLRLGNGASFTCQLWCKPILAQGNAIAAVISQFNNVAATNSFICYLNAGNFRMSLYSTDVTTQDFLIAANPGPAAWHHLIIGYDSTNKRGFSQFDGGARITQATSADLNSVTTDFRFGFSDAANTECAISVNESGFWNRVLTVTDVANLFNAGAGLPFSSFTP